VFLVQVEGKHAGRLESFSSTLVKLVSSKAIEQEIEAQQNKKNKQGQTIFIQCYTIDCGGTCLEALGMDIADTNSWMRSMKSTGWPSNSTPPPHLILKCRDLCAKKYKDSKRLLLSRMHYASP
jgi:hypothetical protein